MLRNAVRGTFALVIGGLGACDPLPSAPPPPHPPGVILLIGDGMGPGAVTAARLSGGPLAMESLRVHGSELTASASSDVTDSGAAATALATGVRTVNGAVGVDTLGRPIETILERAEALGMATGLVATSSVTHATPAAFAAHVGHRSEQYEIAVQMAASGVDVLLGGGWSFFLPEGRPDDVDVVEPFRDRGCVVGVGEDLPSVESGTACLLGLLAEDGLPRAHDRPYTLSELTSIALDVLEENPNGFFLMVEGSQIDWAGHANDGAWLLTEMADFDAAVRTAVERVEARPATLVIVLADHETGGLTAVPGDAAGSVTFQWETGGHTGVPVPMFADGSDPGAARLTGSWPNDAVGRFLLERIDP